MVKRLLLLALILTPFSQCKKENDRAQWDVEVLGPLLNATLGFNQLIGDSSIETLSDGSQIINYDTTFSDFNIDSIYQIADTTIQTTQYLGISLPVQPGNAFFSSNNNITLGVTSVQLKQAIIYSGKIRLEIKNTLRSKINFTYSIPHARKNGLSFIVRASVDSATTASPKYFTGEYDFSGYDVDMTGASGNLFNTISYDVVARSDSDGYPFTATPADTLLNLKSTLVAIQPYFVKGYLGQQQTSEDNFSNTGLGGLIQGGTVALDSVQLNLDIINYIGADEQLYFTYLKSQNSQTGNTVNLVAPTFIQNYLNINRASINSSLPDSLVPTHYSITLNNSNSNIKSLIENLPDQLDYNIKFNLNPLGNISGSNDFVYRDRLIQTRMQLKFPLRFALDQLHLADTVPFTIGNATNFDHVGDANLTLIADNGFPFDLNLQLYLLDSNQTIVDSMFVPDLINAAPYDINYRSTGIERTKIYIPVDADRNKRLQTVQHAIIRIKFNTPDFPQLIQMYSNYKLKLVLVADGIYSIR